MEDFTTQFTISQKIEVMDSEDAIQYTFVIQPIQAGVSGEMRVVVTDPNINAFFTTGEVFDAVISPHVSS